MKKLRAPDKLNLVNKAATSFCTKVMQKIHITGLTEIKFVRDFYPVSNGYRPSEYLRYLTLKGEYIHYLALKSMGAFDREPIKLSSQFLSNNKKISIENGETLFMVENGYEGDPYDVAIANNDATYAGTIYGKKFFTVNDVTYNQRNVIYTVAHDSYQFLFTANDEGYYELALKEPPLSLAAVA